MTESDLDEAFIHYKSALKPIIEDAFGWIEDFQNKRFHSKYDPRWFYWIEANSQHIGYVCFFETTSELHVSLLIIFEAFRNQSYGRNIMGILQQQAIQKSIKVTLSSFKNNTGAVRFYKNLGYDIVSEDTYFYDLALNTL
jgi:ribosomal protein S18 acetylase RimI-like enzyme